MGCGCSYFNHNLEFAKRIRSLIRTRTRISALGPIASYCSARSGTMCRPRVYCNARSNERVTGLRHGHTGWTHAERARRTIKLVMRRCAPNFFPYFGEVIASSQRMACACLACLARAWRAVRTSNAHPANDSDQVTQTILNRNVRVAARHITV